MLLSFEETEELLADYDLPLSKSEEIDSFEEALNFADKNDYPLVLKIFSPEVLHRTEHDLVEVGIETEEQLEKAFEEMENKAKELESAQVIVQNQEEGVQLIYGMKKDETFGPVLMFGLGGIFVEVLEDVSFGITPIDQEEAERVVKNIRGYKLLEGFRNYPSVDAKKAAEFLVKLSNLAEQEDVKEIDFNPVFAEGKEFKIADPKIIV